MPHKLTNKFIKVSNMILFSSSCQYHSFHPTASSKHQVVEDDLSSYKWTPRVPTQKLCGSTFLDYNSYQLVSNTLNHQIAVEPTPHSGQMTPILGYQE